MSVSFSSLMELGGSQLEGDNPYRQYNPYPQCFLHPNRAVVKIIGCDSYALTSQEKLKQLLYYRGPLSVGNDPPYQMSILEHVSYSHQ